jgi:hypothetical protein
LLSLVDPAIGIYAYMINYLVAPDLQWWGAPLVELGTRFSLTLSVCIALGMLLQWRKLANRGPLLHPQEKLIWAFVGVVVLSRLWGVPFDNSLRDMTLTSTSPDEKMPKVAIFIFLLTHSINKYRKVVPCWWIMILVGGLYTGYDGYTAAQSRFVKGRLDLLGGIDFRESSLVAAHLAMVGVLIGIQFLKSRRWIIKAICLIAGAFTVNAIILTQTRAALMALGIGATFALLTAPRDRRILIGGCLLAGAACAFSLTNKEFWSRAETIGATVEESDGFGGGRMDFWKSGIQMGLDHPLGVGAGSFYTVIGTYNPAHRGRDCHQTYIRCFAELGVPGFLLLLALIANAFRLLQRIPRLAQGTPIARDIELDCYGLKVALVVYLSAGFFMGLTYIEELWWLLGLPVCLERAAIRARGDDPKHENYG